MKVLFNPENGASIKNFLFNKRTFAIGVNEKKPFEDAVADRLLETFEFLEEFKPEGKFVCKFGDYANDAHIAVIAHEKGHKEEPAVEEGKDFVTPQELIDEERAGRMQMAADPLESAGDFVDRDGTEWYGEGLSTDGDTKPTYSRRPGAF